MNAQQQSEEVEEAKPLAKLPKVLRVYMYMPWISPRNTSDGYERHVFQRDIEFVPGTTGYDETYVGSTNLIIRGEKCEVVSIADGVFVGNIRMSKVDQGLFESLRQDGWFLNGAGARMYDETTHLINEWGLDYIPEKGVQQTPEFEPVSPMDTPDPWRS